MADYGGLGGGGSLSDAFNQLYPLTNLGGISTGFPPGGSAASGYDSAARAITGRAGHSADPASAGANQRTGTSRSGSAAQS